MSASSPYNNISTSLSPLASHSTSRSRRFPSLRTRCASTPQTQDLRVTVADSLAKSRIPGGAGGGAPITLALWTGTGDGADGPFTICFNIAYSEVDDRTYLRKPPMFLAECNHALEVAFSDCEGGLTTTGEVRVIDGEFRLFFDQAGVFYDIGGTFDGNTASGQATTDSVSGGTCSGAWDATPSP